MEAAPLRPTLNVVYEEKNRGRSFCHVPLSGTQRAGVIERHPFRIFILVPSTSRTNHHHHHHHHQHHREPDAADSNHLGRCRSALVSVTLTTRSPHRHQPPPSRRSPPTMSNTPCVSAAHDRESGSDEADNSFQRDGSYKRDDLHLRTVTTLLRLFN